MKALMPAPGTKPDFATLREQRKTIMTETEQKIDAYLTPEQQAEFAKFHEHHGPPHGNWKPQGSPAPAL